MPELQRFKHNIRRHANPVCRISDHYHSQPNTRPRQEASYHEYTDFAATLCAGLPGPVGVTARQTAL